MHFKILRHMLYVYKVVGPKCTLTIMLFCLFHFCFVFFLFWALF